MPGNDWKLLECELDRWQVQGRPATLWWRDDDAVSVTPALDRMVAMADAAGIGVGLAVIAREAGGALARWLGERANVSVLLHGYAHIDHSPHGQKKAEFGDHRDLDHMSTEVESAWNKLHTLCGAQALPMMVPPWNRICNALVARLPALGMSALSTYAPRTRARPAEGLWQTNCHVDIVDWRGSRGFIGEAAALDLLVGHLAARRTAQVDAAEPTGVLTHHLDHDAGCWSFLDKLFDHTLNHPGALWLAPAEVMSV